jgi:uncharacterized protein YndB with AHSA1/START domain
MTTARPTGRAAHVDGQPAVVFEREFRAPIDDVWAAVTEPDRLERWFGTWSGDPASGSVEVRMNAEGEDVSGSRYDIVRCEPPRHLAVRVPYGDGAWDLRLDLRADAEVTVLALTQVFDDLKGLENIGPGWDWYLDRLVAAETGGDVSALDFDRDYYPALRDHYLGVLADLEG